MPRPGQFMPGWNLYESGLPLLHIDPDELDDHVERHGIGAEWRVAVICPCRRHDTQTPRAGCPVCGGVGFAYPDELRRPIVVLLHSRNERTEAKALGRRESGTASATFPRGIVPARGDLILPDDERHTVQQLIHRVGPDEVDRSALRAELLERRDVNTRVERPRVAGERLLYPSIGNADVELVYWTDDTTGELVRGRVGADVQIKNGLVEWAPRRGPAPHRAYTIHYAAPAAYVISHDASPVYRSDGPVVYPYHATVQRLDRWHASPDRDPRRDA